MYLGLIGSSMGQNRLLVLLFKHNVWSPRLGQDKDTARLASRASRAAFVRLGLLRCSPPPAWALGFRTAGGLASLSSLSSGGAATPVPAARVLSPDAVRRTPEAVVGGSRSSSRAPGRRAQARGGRRLPAPGSRLRAAGVNAQQAQRRAPAPGRGAALVAGAGARRPGL